MDNMMSYVSYECLIIYWFLNEGNQLRDSEWGVFVIILYVTYGINLNSNVVLLFIK